MLALTSLLFTLLLSTPLHPVSALPLNNDPAPVCYPTYQDVSVTYYTMLKGDDSFSALSLLDGVLYTPLNATVAILKDSFGLLPPELHLEEDPQPDQTQGHFEVCEEGDSIYLKFVPDQVPAHPAVEDITEFKLCTYEQTDKLEVSLPERDTRGLSCTVAYILLMQTKVVHPTEHGEVCKDIVPFYLRPITYGTQLSYGGHRRRSVPNTGSSINGLSISFDQVETTTAEVAAPAYITIGTMFKDKAQYLGEWISFYRMLGVSSFLLYDHGSSDNPLQVLRPYIDAGIVTYVHWPPAHADDVTPIPKSMNELDATAQAHFLKKAMSSCLYNEWTTHTQGACQFAASVDMLRRSYGKTSLLGFLDVDEFIYPAESAKSSNLATLFSQAPFAQADYISIMGSNFGTSGHAEAPQGLVTASYHTRRALDNEGRSPFSSGSQQFVQAAENKGALPMTFTVPETYARKAFVRPEKAIYSIVHDWVQQPSATSQWSTVEIGLDYPDIKFNHYAFLSRADADRKAQVNGNPMAAYDAAQDAFYSAEEDHSIKYLLPALRQVLGSA